jgi:hypothetical protein
MRAVRRLRERAAARRALAATLVVAFACSAAATTSASPLPLLTYIVGYGTSKQQVVVANIDGGEPLTLGNASAAMLSPDGSQVAALDTAATSTLRVYASAGGVARTLFSTHSFMQILGWSPDSKLLLVAVGTTRSQLLSLDVATAIHTTVATGVLKGASFEPGTSNAIVYSLGGSSDKGFNLFVTTPAGTPTRQLTRDGRSEFPVWGDRGIVYSRATPLPHSGASQPKGGTPAPLQLWFIRPGGTGMRQLTDVKMPKPNFTGLTPIGFSADGQHLLANLVGPNWYEAYVLDLSHAKPALRDLTGQFNGGTIGDAISASGALILATKGSLSDQAALSIEEISWPGGKPTVIAKNGAYASWNQ